MNNEQKKSNGSIAPLAIIGGVLVLALIAFYYFYSNPTVTITKTATNKKTDTTNYADLYAKAKPGASPAHFLGAPNATVTLEEFADFQCPTCAATHPKIQEIRAAYGDRVRIIFREFPLNIPAHDKAYDAAVAAEAAGMQGKFWEMQNLLFTNQQSWEHASDYRKIFADYAQKLGLDVDKFTTDMAGLPAKKRVDDDKERGNSLNVNGTPSIFLNGRMLNQQETLSVDLIRQAIDAELQKAQSAPVR